MAAVPPLLSPTALPCLLALVMLLAGCGQAPLKPAATHLRSGEPAAAGAIPAPAQRVPALPKPAVVARAETYSVVVHNVAVHDLLFALARNAKLNVDIHPEVSGTVTLNAVEQTLPQLLARIARQVDMRHEMIGDTLVVTRDTPHLRAYRVDYVSAERRVEMNSNLSTQFSAGGAAAATTTGATGTTGSTARVEIKSTNRLWETIVENVKEILQETDRILPPEALEAVGGRQVARRTRISSQSQPGLMQNEQLSRAETEETAVQPTRFREAAHVIANRESGTLYVRATTRQHEHVQEFLDQVMARVKQQVLIEVTVAEVALNDEYQRGIDWRRMRSGASATGSAGFGTGGTGFDFSQSTANTPAGVGTGNFVVGYSNTASNVASAVQLLESFGTVRVLSSPKLSVLNNQTALLRVTRDLVYFTITPQQVSVTSPGGGGNVTVAPAFTTTPNIAAAGFMMGVLPQIGEGDSVVLNVRPTIRRKLRDVADPNPALGAIQNLIPEFETREFESILRIQSGQTAVLGGLMQDEVSNVEDGVPGLSSIPLLGELFKHRRDVTRKIELVIFLRPTVIVEASLDGDFARFRGLAPKDDFFLKPDLRRRDLRAKPADEPAAGSPGKDAPRDQQGAP
ncbi:MAG: type II and III secretion system protein [Betaproteobacteria bacterium]|nr:type II and III secretion system protein [Betaproteobacteria bacterium]